MIERFRDLMFFAMIGTFVTIVVFAWLALTVPAMTFVDRWVNLPPAVVFPAKKSLPEVPLYFCARYVSTTRCRIA